MTHLVEQLLNGVQFGVMLFLMAAGLTLVFGIMNLINLAHGSLYMIGAYVAAAVFGATGSFLLGLALAIAAAMGLGHVIEIAVFRRLYARDHLDQVLATFGLILFFDEIVRMLWGSTALYMPVPGYLSGRVQILPGSAYPVYRLAIVAVGLALAGLLYMLIARTRLGMLIRAGASNRVMLGALGVNVRLLYTLVFVLGAGLAALAGSMAGPIFTVESGMGEGVLILAFVVIVIGGIGSVRGAFVAALLVGIVDAVGRAYLRPLLGLAMSRAAADNAGPALASMLIYLVMAAVLFVRPQGLFPPRGR
ncbi:MAG: branched-chain amino acid ABC transporter permease [Alphaproteobacteria bacterium]|nr:branched-chain amino acid ABC transporter permease [Alphaproteobacteria bacterium]